MQRFFRVWTVLALFLLVSGSKEAAKEMPQTVLPEESSDVLWMGGKPVYLPVFDTDGLSEEDDPFRFFEQDDLRRDGFAYFVALVKTAAVDLRRRGVMSRYLDGHLVADREVAPIVLTLILTEQVRHGSMASVELVEQECARVAVDGQDAYHNTRSPVGALGIGQLMEKTYVALREMYPEAGLIEDPDEGRRDHLNAVKAVFLHVDAEWWAFRGSLRDALVADDEMRPLAFAAGYNTSGRHVARAISACADRWSEASCARKLPGQTRAYIRKFVALSKMFFERPEPLAYLFDANPNTATD
ncbi:hypothetical protein HY734_02620 [Candidatus Uhrbacteria bacterium]|nr:hypothetical protein [Candidatus Uhrbacteria bacterium]